MKPINFKPLLAALALALPFAANAESDFTTGAGALTSNARVDFSIVIPKVLYLRVGTGTLLADNATIDLVTFTVPAANVGDATAIAGTGGDLTAGVVTARLIGNNGDISLNVTTGGALSNGAGDSIAYSQITTTVSALVTATQLAAPTLTNGASPAITIPATAKVVNRDARWTYAYANAAVVPPGTYGSTVANNGRATYTASMP